MENTPDRLQPLVTVMALAIAAESQPSWHAGERVHLVDGSVMSI